MIKNYSQKLFKSQLIAGSFVMMIGSLAAGFGSYLYHLLMGRMLGPVNYGVLASVISLSYLLSIPVSTLNLVVVKFVSNLKSQGGPKAVSVLFKLIRKKGTAYGLMALSGFLILTPFLASFLHLDSILPLVLVGVFTFITVILMVNRATLQGLLRFDYLAASNVLETILKVSLAVLLVRWGFKVDGALFAIVVGMIVSYLFTLYPLRELTQARVKEKNFKGREMVAFAIPVFFSTLAFTSLYTTDIILVRHFFEAQQAGFYAALAVLGKIVFFVSSPIVLVMFPMVSERYTNKKEYKSLFLMSLGLVGAACLGIGGFYFLFPALMIKTLFGIAYLSAAPYLGLFGVFLSLYSFCFLLVNFYLSTNRTKVVILPIVTAGLQIILIALWHQNLGQVIQISIWLTALLLFSLLLYNFFLEDRVFLVK